MGGGGWKEKGKETQERLFFSFLDGFGWYCCSCSCQFFFWGGGGGPMTNSPESEEEEEEEGKTGWERRRP